MKKKLVCLMTVLLLFSLVACSTNTAKGLLNNFDAFSETVQQMSGEEILSMFGEMPGWIVSENCYVYLDSRGNGLCIYFDEDYENVNKVEKVKRFGLKITDSSTNAEKITFLLDKMLGKSKKQIEKKYGELGPLSGFPGGNCRVYGVDVTVYLDDFEGDVCSISISS